PRAAAIPAFAARERSRRWPFGAVTTVTGTGDAGAASPCPAASTRTICEGNRNWAATDANARGSVSRPMERIMTLTPGAVPPVSMSLFYSDVFVLPLPAHHRFPMGKYVRLRERLIASGAFDAADFIVPP